jgi:hypothetical protein
MANWLYMRNRSLDEDGNPVETTEVVETTGEVRLQFPTASGIQFRGMHVNALYSAEVSDEAPAEAKETKESKKSTAKAESKS